MIIEGFFNEDPDSCRIRGATCYEALELDLEAARGYCCPRRLGRFARAPYLADSFQTSRYMGPWRISVVSVTALVPIMAMWIGFRVLLGLYPGYGLDAVEELRRHTYATLSTLAILAIFALSLQVVNLLSRLLLALVFLGLLLSAPFVRSLVKRGLNGAQLWGKPVVILGYKEPKTNLVDLLKVNWELGYNLVAVFDYPVFDHRLADNEGSV